MLTNFANTPSSTANAGLGASILVTLIWSVFDWLYLAPRGLVAPATVVAGVTGFAAYLASWGRTEQRYEMKIPESKQEDSK